MKFIDFREGGRQGGSNLQIDRTMEEGRRALRCGVLKVVVAHGTNLAIRDFTSSDPYVVVRLADMVSPTSPSITQLVSARFNLTWLIIRQS